MDNDVINKGVISENLVETEFKAASHIIPVIEEHIHIGKDIIETGKVKIAKKVLVANYDADIPVFKEEVIIERKPINEFIDGNAPGIRLEGDTTIIPIIKEVMVKRMMLVEELYVTKRRIEQTASVHETLRREEVFIKRNDGQDPAAQINQ